MHAQLQSQPETAPPVPSVRTALLRRAAVNASPANAVPSLVHEVLRSPGQPLDAATRAFIEPRFGHDFSGVRVHADAKAAESARAVNARAYTVGENVVFGAGQFMPTAHTGQLLLAHELTHVMQQSNNQTAMQHSSLAISKPDDASEREADRIANGVMGSSVLERLQTDSGKSGGSVMLQRTIGDGHDLRSPRFAGDPVLEACFDNEQFLRFGSRGPAVAKLQQALVDAGFPLPVFGVDGIFESETQTAVQNYQRAHVLSPDGIVGPITMEALDAQFAGGPPAPGPAPAPPGPAPAPPGPAPAPPETITSQTVALTPGARTRTTIGVGEEVKLTHAPGSAGWTTSVGPTPLSATNGDRVIFTAPDTAPATTQRITVTAGAATISFDVLAPTSVAQERVTGTGVKHTVNQPDSGIAALTFLARTR